MNNLHLIPGFVTKKEVTEKRIHLKSFLCEFGKTDERSGCYLVQFVSQDFYFHLVQVGLGQGILEKLSFDTTSNNCFFSIQHVLLVYKC